MLLARDKFKQEINDSIQFYPVTAILGPRQCGKTTLAKMVAESYNSTFFDLEDPADQELLKLSPKNILTQQKGIIIIDEIQRIPELFPVLRVLADERDSNRKFLILGSASPDLIQKSSESLAGRIGFVNLSGFNLNEINSENLEKLWLRGGFPRSFLAQNDKLSYNWRNDFIRTFLERDLLQLGFNIPSAALRRFWIMLAHYHGQVWNGAEFARAMGVSEPTVKRYLDILSGAFMVRQLQPWFENLKKRQVKAPKIYIRDSGILHTLLTLEGSLVLKHIKSGASWEGFILEQIIHIFDSANCYYWRTHTGAEIDLFVISNGKRFGFEIKKSEVSKVTKSMRIVADDLNLDHLYLINNGKRKFVLEKGISVIPGEQIFQHEF